MLPILQIRKRTLSEVALHIMKLVHDRAQIQTLLNTQSYTSEYVLSTIRFLVTTFR